MLNPPSRRTAADEAELALLQGVMDGTVASGTHLRLQDLADQLGMSMMPIREALRRLESLGLVEIVAHKGAWVRPLTLEDLLDTYFTRIHLESVALMTAAGRFTAEHAEKAHGLLEEMRQAEDRGDLIDWRNAHEHFHFALYGASGSKWLVRSIMPLWRNSERYRVESMRNPEHVHARDAEHSGMLDALQREDASEAAALLVVHLRSSVELLVMTANVESTDEEPTVVLPTVQDILGASAEQPRKPRRVSARTSVSRARKPAPADA